jgi:hypothetical protein
VASLLTLVPDLHFEAKRVYLGADHIVFEYDMSGTAGGTSFICDGADVIAVTDRLGGAQGHVSRLGRTRRSDRCASRDGRRRPAPVTDGPHDLNRSLVSSLPDDGPW